MFSARSFYAVHKVTRDGPTTLKLASGNTLHGEQDLSPAMRREPLTYYHHASPIGDVMKAWAGSPERRNVGVIGLGAGTLAAYSEPGERWTFFEIDPVVVEVARDRFTYLGDARGEVNVVLGDGRLSLVAVPDGTFGLLVLDAFSSDAVPVHLLTREALALYLRKLAPGGLLAFHLSNRHLALAEIVAGGRRQKGWSACRARAASRLRRRARASPPPAGWCWRARPPISNRSRRSAAGARCRTEGGPGPTTPPASGRCSISASAERRDQVTLIVAQPRTIPTFPLTSALNCVQVEGQAMIFVGVPTDGSTS